MSSDNPDAMRQYGALPAQKRKVLIRRWTQSPMNARRWVADLACGHEVWMTCGRRPTAKSMICPDCFRAQKGGTR